MMEAKPKEPKTTPRKGKTKFCFDAPIEAPVFEPTLEEFENPLEYIKKIRITGEKSGICKIIPPKGWKSPFVIDKEKLKFTPRIQRINELEARTRIKLNFIDQLTKFFALRGKTFQIPVVEKISLDLYTLHRHVKENGGIDEVNKNKKWSEVASAMGFVSKNSFASLKHNYEDLILPFLISQKDEARDMICSRSNEKSMANHLKGIDCQSSLARELRSLQFLGAGPKMAVCEEGELLKDRTRGKKILYQFDPLAKYMCKSCLSEEIEEPHVTCCSCQDRYHSSCLIPRLIDIPENWRCPKCVAAEVCKPLEDFGFAQAEREYNLNEFKTMADNFKKNYFKSDIVPASTVEQEFWRVVSSIDEAVTVEYGADLHVIDHGSGFPRKNKPCIDGIDSEEFEKYASSPWNLNNLPVLNSSVLRYISADISGMKIPWMYAGMCFAAFCWHNEDHWSYSINYLHLGEPKTWYGVSGSYAEKFEKAMRNAAPELFAAQPDLLHHLVTIMNPNDLMSAGVPVCRTDQKEGEFVITFPRAYHAGFNQGFNFAEACNFAPYDWLQMGRECIYHYASLKRPCVFSHDELVVHMASIADELDRDIAEATLKDMVVMVNAESVKWERAVMFGINKVMTYSYTSVPDDERVCSFCNTTVFLSAVFCPCNRSKLVCLYHIHKLCECDPDNYIIKCPYRIGYLWEVIKTLKNKLFKFEEWLKKVENALSPNVTNKISLRSLTELLIEAKEKDFPECDLIDLLEFQVRKSIDCSALARVIVGNSIMKVDTKNKLTVDDIAMFYDEILKLPCIISETSSLKKLLDEALKFQRMASTILSKNIGPRSKITNCIKLGKSLDLDILELPLLEKRLEEFEWIEKGETLLLNKTVIPDKELQELLKTCPDSKNNIKVSLIKDDLLNIAHLSSSQIEEIETKDIEIVDDKQFLKVKADDELMEVTEPIITPAALADPKVSELLNSIMKVLSGNDIKYLDELESLFTEAKLHPVSMYYLNELEDVIKNANKWFVSGKQLFLNRNNSFSLLQALWPRRFESRIIHFQRSLLKDKTNIECLIDKHSNLTKSCFDSAFKEQIQTLNNLRIENLESSVQITSSFSKCVCRDSCKQFTIKCVLCQTSYHVNCFKKMAKSYENSIYYQSLNRKLCSYCIITKRPPLEKIGALCDSACMLKVQIPECIALKLAYEKMLDWQNDAKEFLSTQSTLIILNFITENPQNISPITRDGWNFYKKNLSKSSANVQKCVKLNPEDSTTLRYLILRGDLLEFTSIELEQLWTIYYSWLNNTNLGLLNIQKEASNSPKKKVVKPLSTGKKKSHKRKIFTHKKKISLQDVDVDVVRLPPIIIRQRRKSANKTSKQKLTTDLVQPQAPYWEEHEAGDPCASVNCQKPTDLNVSWVQCDGKCAQWFHMKCVNMEDKKLNDDDEYVCNLYFLCQFINKLEHPEVDLQHYIHHTLSVSEQLSKLSDGIALLDKELQRQVLEKHEDLVSQATWVEKLQEVLSIMHIHVQSLVSSVERVKIKVVEPYQKLETQSIVLSRLHETTDLLRRASRIQHLSRKLPDLDPTRAAHVLAELDELHRDVDLSGLEILEPEEKQIKIVKASVEQKANRIVEQGLALLNPEKVAIGIDILDKLSLAEIEVQKMMDKWLNSAETNVKNSLNMENLIPVSTRGGAGRVSGISIPANIQNFRSELWTSWENTLNKSVYTMCAQMAVIQTVLNNRLTYRNGKMSGNDEKSEVAYVFWCQIDDILTKQLNLAARNSSYMKQALEGEYPKLLRLHLDLHKKLKALNAAESNTKPMFPPIGKCVKQFETAYLTRSVNVLTGAVQDMFSQNDPNPQPPSREKVDSLVKTISRELDVALVDEALASPVARNAAKAISLFCQKGEQMLINTSAATQVIESQTPGQELNVGIANIVFYFCEQLKNTVTNQAFSKNIISHLNKAISEGESLTQQILNPLLASILVAIEAILLTMHKEDYDLKEYSGSTSLYMRELHAFIARAYISYLTPFHNQLQISLSCMEVASRTIELFIRHTSLIRPLNENGRKKLITDFKCLEEALQPLCAQLSELGAIYSTLRSLRPLITAKPDEVAMSPVLGQVIPYSLAATLLFSMGPSDLPSPQQSVGWSIAKYSEWLDAHTNEADRLELLKGALSTSKSSNPFHNILKDLIDRGNAHILTGGT